MHYYGCTWVQGMARDRANWHSRQPIYKCVLERVNFFVFKELIIPRDALRLVVFCGTFHPHTSIQTTSTLAPRGLFLMDKRAKRSQLLQSNGRERTY